MTDVSELTKLAAQLRDANANLTKCQTAETKARQSTLLAEQDVSTQQRRYTAESMRCRSRNLPEDAIGSFAADLREANLRLMTCQGDETRARQATVKAEQDVTYLQRVYNTERTRARTMGMADVA